MTPIHHCKTLTTWVGNRGNGTYDYKAYDRNHDIAIAGKSTLTCSSDPACGQFTEVTLNLNVTVAKANTIEGPTHCTMKQTKCVSLRAVNFPVHHKPVASILSTKF
jgi:hypothetical protein